MGKKLKPEPIKKDHIKELVVELVDTFGFYIDLDRWDEKGWVRVKAQCYKDADCVIVYKDQLEIETGREKEYLQDEFAAFWRSIGEFEFKKKLNSLISLDAQ